MNSNLCVRVIYLDDTWIVRVALRHRLNFGRVLARMHSEWDADQLAARVAERIGKKNERRRKVN